MRTTISVSEISERLGICEETVYDMVRKHVIPNIRHGHRFIISRAAYERWEATIGENVPAVPQVVRPVTAKFFELPRLPWGFNLFKRLILEIS
ncbi:MAG: helix-turn-helix domain-containing protein [Bryobacterales bacterium]|nr:helix-turn-helix domain-containing protein [Bryobacterales bacterium]